MKPTFLTLFHKFTADNELNVAIGTHRHYQCTAGHLEKFLNKTKRIALSLSDVDFDFVEDFKRFCITDLGMSNGTANNQITRLKRFLQYQHDKGAYDQLNFKRVKLFEYRIQDQKIIYLTRDEIVRLYSFKFGRSYQIELPQTAGKRQVKNVSGKTLEKVRDLFILGCFTGLRFSDIAQISNEDIHDGFIELTTVKTRKPLSIPVILYAKDVLEKYPDGLPVISQQKLNLYIKKICQIVGINDKIKIPTWRGRDRKDQVFSKYDLITSHTMKKTFVMLCVSEGIPVEVVASITGNSLATISHYYEIKNETKIRHLQKLVESFGPVMKVS